MSTGCPFVQIVPVRGGSRVERGRRAERGMIRDASSPESSNDKAAIAIEEIQVSDDLRL